MFRNRRFLLRFSMVVLFSCVSAWALGAFHQRVRFAEKFDALGKEARTREDVHAIMGRPPGYYTREVYLMPRDLTNMILNSKESTWDYWSGADCGVYVQYSGNKPVYAWRLLPFRDGDSVFAPRCDRRDLR